MDDRLSRQMRFILEIDKCKLIERQTYISDVSRKENDAEHSWHLALMAYILQEHANESIDIARVMIMVLLHDIVEIDAGDTYAYDEKAHEDKREREVRAADRLYSLLPNDQATMLYEIWEEFENGITPEAKFAHTLDNIQPMMLNDATHGRAWREHGVYEHQILKRNEHTKEGSDNLWNYASKLIDKNIQDGNIKQ